MLGKTVVSNRKNYSLKAIFWVLAIFLGALQVGANFYIQTADDIIAYLDIGEAYFRGDWDTAINAYWSPLYSWILGLTLAVFKPSSYWEFPLVKIINFLIYLFALVWFEFFLRELIFYYNHKLAKEGRNRAFKIPSWVWIVCGYTLFIFSSLQWIGVYSDSPDMLVAAFVYIATGLILRISRHSDSWLNFLILGTVLGLGYLSKAVMFPLGFVFLVVSLFSAKNLRQALPKALAALLVFTIIVTPFIATISTAKNRLTFGDTGKLNYEWLVTNEVIPYRFWQGKEPGHGIPKHPVRQIFDNPKVFEFEKSGGGTYSPWHDPSYWYEGLVYKFSLKRQLIIIGKNSIFYYKQFIGILIFAYLILVCVSGRFWLSIKNLIGNWILIIPAAAGLGIYMLVIDMPTAFQPTRYIAPFIVLLFAGVFTSVRLPNSPESKRLIAGMSIATLVIISSQVFGQAAKNLRTVLSGSQQHIEWEAAQSLQQLGLRPGEKVAVLGQYLAPHYHWARLARVKIVAEVFDEKSFWEADPVIRAEILRRIKNTGVKAIVQRPGFKIPNGAIAPGWRKVGNTDYYAYFFNK